MRRDIERKGEEIWKTYCRNPPGYPTLFPPVPQLPSKLRDKLTDDKEDVMLRYQGEAAVHRALANISEDLVVLQGFEFTHQEFGLYMSQARDSDKADKEIEGGCDFMAISDNHVSILDVRSLGLNGDGAGDVFLKNFKESVELRAKVSKLALRIIIKTFRFKMPTVRQYTVFPNILRSDCEKIPQFTALSDSEKSSLLFSDDLDNFTTWWAHQNKVEKGKKDNEFHLALQRVKQTLIGIWSMDRDSVSDTGDCGLGNSLISLEASMKGGKTVEIDECMLAINRPSNKVTGAKANGGKAHDRLYGVRPVLHLVTRKIGHETVPLATLLSSILETETRNLADLDPATTAIVILNGDENFCSLLDSNASIKKYEEVVAATWTAITCIVDLSEVFRLSAMKAGQYLDLDALLVRLKSVLETGTSYFSVVVIVGATEVQGDKDFIEFGSETINKTNRQYFQKGKTALCNLVEAMVSQSCVKFYDTVKSSNSSDCVRLSWSEIKKKLDTMLVFPDKKINKEAIISISNQINTIDNHVLSIASKVNTQKSATKNWVNKLGPGCRNDELKRVKNTIDKLQEGISEMMEIHGKLTTQLRDLSQLYQEVYEEVEVNID